jgi:hypothetical protein
MTEEAKSMCRRYVDVEEKAKLILQHASMEAKGREVAANYHDKQYKIMTRPKVLKRALINSYLTVVHEKEAAAKKDFDAAVNEKFFTKNVEEYKKDDTKRSLQSSLALDAMTQQAHILFALRNLQKQVEEISEN